MFFPIPNAVPFVVLRSPRSRLFLGYSLVMGVTGGLMAATTLLALHVLTRNLWLSVFLCFLTSSVFFAANASGPSWYRFAYAGNFVAVALTLFSRFGLLALSMCAVPFFTLRTAPVTLDTNAWYFGRSGFALLMRAALALYGFFVSLGGKRWLLEVAVNA